MKRQTADDSEFDLEKKANPCKLLKQGFYFVFLLKSPSFFMTEKAYDTI